jgi:hypothetical protein
MRTRILDVWAFLQDAAMERDIQVDLHEYVYMGIVYV